MAVPVVHTEIDFVDGASVDPDVNGANWVDVTSYVRADPGITIKRGRQRDLDRFEAGTCTLTLDNRDRRFEPEYAAGAYYPNVLVNRQLRVTAGYLSEVLLDKPSAMFRFGEASGLPVVNTVRSGVGGTYNGTGVTLAQTGNIVGRTSVLFDGAAGYASFVSNAAWTLTTTWTIEFYLKPSALAAKSLVTQDAGANGFLIQLTALGEIKYLIQGGASTLTTAGAGITTNAFFHVVVVSTAGNITIYVNGVSKASGNPTKPSNANAAMLVGKDTAGNFYNGKIEDLAIYKTGLASGRVTTHYNEGAKGVSDGFLFYGYVDTWPPLYPAKKDAVMAITATDAFKIFAGTRLPKSVWAYQIQKLVTAGTVKTWWRLNDPPGTTLPFDSGPSTFSATVGGTPLFGGSSVLPWGDSSTETSCSFAFPQPETSGDYVAPATASALLGNNWTIEALIKLPPITTANDPNSDNNTIYAQFQGGNWYIRLLVASDGTVLAGTGSILSPTVVVSTIKVDDGKPHHIVARRTWNGATGVLEVYIDGVLAVTTALNVATVGGASTISIGADNAFAINAGSIEGWLGDLSDVLTYDTALSASDIATHASWALTPWNGDTSDARASKVAEFFLPSTMVSVGQAGASILQSTSLKARTGDILSYLYAIGETEEGLMLMGPDGVMTLSGRDYQYLSPGNVIQNVFGDRNNGTDIPYTEITPAYDEVFLFNESHAGREQGVVFTLIDTSSQTSHGQRVHERTDLMHQTDAEAIDHANWIVYRSKTAHLEFRELKFEPASIANPTPPTSIWTAALIRSIGDKLEVVRTPPGGGAIIDKTTRIQGITHEIREAGKFWTVTFELSGFVDQYWILGDATYGVLGTTTIVGF